MEKKHILDNCKIKIKLMMIFIFCVIVPLIVTDGIMITLVNRYTKREEENNLNKQLDSVEYSLSSVINLGISAANDMYRDRGISNFLNKEYKNGTEYLDEYKNLVENNLQHYHYGALMIKKITVYGDNETLINGGYVYKVSAVKDKKWYKTLSNYKEEEMPIIVDIDYELNEVNVGKRTVSIIRKINYFEKSKEKIVKIDLEYNAVEKTISNNQIVGQVYVCDKDRVLLSNSKNNYINEDFKSIDSVDMKKVRKTRDIDGFGKEWKVYIISDEMSIVDELKKDWQIYVVMIIINLLIPTITILVVGNSFKVRILLLEEKMRKIKHEKFEELVIEAGHDEIGKLVITYNTMVKKIKKLIKVVYKEKMEKQELELAKKEAEITALHAQIDPHFLFNILENIRMRSLIKGEDETADVIGELSVMMRKSYDWGKDLVRIEEEIEFATAYLKLQKYRFGDKLDFEFYISDEYKKVKIPKLTIVTFVENAVVHGIEKVIRNAKIIVTTKKVNEYMLIKIQDTGNGIKPEDLEEIKDKIYKKYIGCLNDAESIGLLNTYHRLLLNFGNRLKFTIDSEYKEGTIVRISIPLECIQKQ